LTVLATKHRIKTSQNFENLSLELPVPKFARFIVEFALKFLTVGATTQDEKPLKTLKTWSHGVPGTKFARVFVKFFD
jgi:hypothetical protein